jgi:hypothetical protein
MSSHVPMSKAVTDLVVRNGARRLGSEAVPFIIRETKTCQKPQIFGNGDTDEKSSDTPPFMMLDSKYRYEYYDSHLDMPVIWNSICRLLFPFAGSVSWKFAVRE